MTSDQANLEQLLAPLREDPANSAVLLDVDGTLAPIVDQPDDAHVHEATRRPLIDIARRYGTVACVSGRRATDARRIVSLGTIAYLGSHGTETLLPGATGVQVDPEVDAWARRVQAFADERYDEALRRLRVRREDKHAIVALHWRGVPDEDRARAAIEEVAKAAEETGLHTHWGRKVLELRPPVQMDKGIGIVKLLAGRQLNAAIFVGDDTTDLDAFRGLGELVEAGTLGTAIRIGVRSGEQPSALADQADAMVDGTDGVRQLLLSLL